MNLEWRTESWIECQELEAEEAVDKILNYSAMLVWITKGFYSGKQSVFFRFTKAIYHYKRIKEHFSLKVRWKRWKHQFSVCSRLFMTKSCLDLPNAASAFLHLLIINRSFAYIIHRAKFGILNSGTSLIFLDSRNLYINAFHFFFLDNFRT